MFGYDPPPMRGEWRFSLLGVPVRVHPYFWLAIALLGIGPTAGEPRELVLWVAAAFAAILLHEAGHAAAAVAFNYRPSITLYGFGGFTTYRPGYKRPDREALITLAGPLAGFVIAILILAAVAAANGVYAVAFGGPLFIQAAVHVSHPQLNSLVNAFVIMNIFWGLLNLLPVWPLDGGHLVRSVLEMLRRRDAFKRTLEISMVAAIIVALYGLVRLHSTMAAIMFAAMAYNNYNTLRNHGYQGGDP